MKSAWINPLVFSAGLLCAVVGATHIQPAYGWITAGLVLMGVIAVRIRP